MPFKSQKQRAKFYSLLEEGKIDKKTVNEFEKNTPKDLPDRVKPIEPLTGIDRIKGIKKIKVK